MPRIEDLIAASFEGLTNQQRNAARFALSHQGDVAFLSMRRLAARANLPPATFVRLARALGFPDYLSFRAGFQDLIREDSGARFWAPRARELQSRQERGRRPPLIRDVFNADVENLHRTLGQNRQETLVEAIRVLERGRRVLVIGQRSCFPAAYLFSYVARLFRDDVVLLRGTSGTFADDLRGIAVHEVLLALSVEPYTAGVVRAVRYAKQRGASLVALTDTKVSPIARLADVTLLVATNTPSFFHSVTGLITVVQALLAELVARGNKRALERIEASEQQLEEFGTYWRDDGSK